MSCEKGFVEVILSDNTKRKVEVVDIDGVKIINLLSLPTSLQVESDDGKFFSIPKSEIVARIIERFVTSGPSFVKKKIFEIWGLPAVINANWLFLIDKEVAGMVASIIGANHVVTIPDAPEDRIYNNRGGLVGVKYLQRVDVK
ncbi:MAG: hypothetical protein ACOX6Q_01435 [Candidatus Dojkabacteria bacterium]|jgi:hypothetical protein